MNNLFAGTVGSYCGVRIVEDPNMVDPVEDWSEVRSPSRAKRRKARGFRQRIKTVYVPKKTAYALDNGRMMVMHPEMRRQLEAETKKDQEQRDSEAFLRKEKPEPKSDTPWNYGAAIRPFSFFSGSTT